MKRNGILFKHGVLNANEVMIDYLKDNQRRLKRVMDEINDSCLHWKSAPDANSIAVTLWHMGRLLDVFLTQQANGEPSEHESWFRCGWAQQTRYDPRGLGQNGWGAVVGYTIAEAAAIPRFTREQVLGYLDDVYSAASTYIQNTPMAELAEAAPGFEGRYTKYQVLSMAILDNVRHLGEIYTIKAMWGRTRQRTNLTPDP
ncbi:MAG: DinB family protein [Anaerolineales bacterium]